MTNISVNPVTRVYDKDGLAKEFRNIYKLLGEILQRLEDLENP